MYIKYNNYNIYDNFIVVFCFGFNIRMDKKEDIIRYWMIKNVLLVED